MVANDRRITVEAFWRDAEIDYLCDPIRECLKTQRVVTMKSFVRATGCVIGTARPFCDWPLFRPSS
jgi:hypothetical protein